MYQTIFHLPFGGLFGKVFKSKELAYEYGKQQKLEIFKIVWFEESYYYELNEKGIF